MKIDVCVNRLGEDAYLGSYSVSGWTSPMSYTASSEHEVIEIIKANIRAKFAQPYVKMYTLDFPDIHFPEVATTEQHISTKIAKKRGRPRKVDPNTTKPDEGLSTLIPPSSKKKHKK
jgi:hypothetical protein